MVAQLVVAESGTVIDAVENALGALHAVLRLLPISSICTLQSCRAAGAADSWHALLLSLPTGM